MNGRPQSPSMTPSDTPPQAPPASGEASNRGAPPTSTTAGLLSTTADNQIGVAHSAGYTTPPSPQAVRNPMSTYHLVAGVRLSSCSDRLYIPTPYNSPDRGSPNQRHLNAFLRGPVHMNWAQGTVISTSTLQASGSSLSAVPSTQNNRPSSNPVSSPQQGAVNGHVSMRGGSGKRIGSALGPRSTKKVKEAYHDCKRILSAASSPIFKPATDLKAILSHPRATQYLHEARVDIQDGGFTGEVLTSATAQFKEDGQCGRFQSSFLKNSTTASRRRIAGEFDAYHQEEFNELWGEDDPDLSDDEVIEAAMGPLGRGGGNLNMDGPGSDGDFVNDSSGHGPHDSIQGLTDESSSDAPVGNRVRSDTAAYNVRQISAASLHKYSFGSSVVNTDHSFGPDGSDEIVYIGNFHDFDPSSVARCGCERDPPGYCTLHPRDPDADSPRKVDQEWHIFEDLESSPIAPVADKRPLLDIPSARISVVNPMDAQRAVFTRSPYLGPSTFSVTSPRILEQSRYLPGDARHAAFDRHSYQIRASSLNASRPHSPDKWNPEEHIDRKYTKMSYAMSNQKQRFRFFKDNDRPKSLVAKIFGKKQKYVIQFDEAGVVHLIKKTTILKHQEATLKRAAGMKGGVFQASADPMFGGYEVDNEDEGQDEGHNEGKGEGQGPGPGSTKSGAKSTFSFASVKQKVGKVLSLRHR